MKIALHTKNGILQSVWHGSVVSYTLSSHFSYGYGTGAIKSARMKGGHYAVGAISWTAIRLTLYNIMVLGLGGKPNLINTFKQCAPDCG